MPMHQASCPRCQDDLFVRAEQIISGLRVMQALYCGRCNHEWSVEKPAQNGEKQRGERRTLLRTKRDRRKSG
jgi:hypothetical protein